MSEFLKITWTGLVAISVLWLLVLLFGPLLHPHDPVEADTGTKLITVAAIGITATAIARRLVL